MTTQNMPIVFGSLNEGDDPKALPPGTLLRVHNCAMDKPRRLKKRDGTVGLTKAVTLGSNIAAGMRLLLCGTSLALTDSQTAWTYGEQVGLWNPIDRIPHLRVTKRGLVDTTRSVSAADIAISGDLLVTFYQVGTAGVYVQVDNLATGEPLLSPKLVSVAGIHCRALIDAGIAYLVYSDTGTNVNVVTLDLATLVLGANTNISTAAKVSTVIDACIGTPAAGVPTLYVLFELAAGASRANIASFTLATLAPVATLASVGTGMRCACIVFGDLAQRVTASWSSTTSTNTRITSCDPSLGAQVGPTTVYAGISDAVFVAEDDATNVLVAWNRDDGSGTDADRLTTALYSVAAHAIVTSSRRVTFGLYNPTKPWRTGGRWFTSAVTLVHPYTFTGTRAIAQPSTVVVEIETADSLTGVQDATHPHVATMQNQTGWFAPGLGQTKAAADASGAVWLASPYRSREPTGYGDTIPVGFELFRLAAAAGDAFRSARLGAGALIAGGAPVWDDGATLMPYGFAHSPQLISITPTAGGSMVAGVYGYVVTYAWRDANGILHRSMPSPPLTGTAAAANLSMTIKVATSSLSAKQRALVLTDAANPIVIELWRTTVGGTGSHYRLTSEPTYQVLFNDPRAGDVSILDTKADANIASGGTTIALAAQQVLYTDLGELENLPPPAFTTCTTHHGRLVGIGPDERTVWLSKDSNLDPTLAPGFHEELTESFTARKTALASLDAVLVVFGDDTIDVIQGDGPADDGGNNTWQVQPVQTDVGCRNPRSVVTLPMGVMFESPRGIEILSRGLEIGWIGKPVRDQLAAYPVITSAVLVAAVSEVRFTCTTTDGTSGVTLVFDYEHKSWFTRGYTDAQDTLVADVAFVDAALIGTTYTMLTAAGQVYRETSAHHLDNGTAWVGRDVILAPVSAAGALAWQRVKDLSLLGTSVTAHDLEVSFARDYATSYEEVRAFEAGSDATAVGPLEKCRVTLARQKCQAMQIRIRDLTPSNSADNPIGTGAGPLLEGLMLRVGVKGGSAKTSKGQQG